MYHVSCVVSWILNDVEESKFLRDANISIIGHTQNLAAKPFVETCDIIVFCVDKIPSLVSPCYCSHRQGVDNRGMLRRDNIWCNISATVNCP